MRHLPFKWDGPLLVTENWTHFKLSQYLSAFAIQEKAIPSRNMRITDVVCI